MCSTMTTRIIQRIIFIALVELAVLVLKEQPSPSLLLIVCYLATLYYCPYSLFIFIFKIVTNLIIDQKQARDLVAVLTEAKQQIDPRLMEMTRYGGGGGGRYGGGGYRGGRGGGRGGGKFALQYPHRSIADGTNKGGRW
jgi:uncharacterized membrane protein YgcG